MAVAPVVVVAGVAWAAATDNMFPTANTGGTCVVGPVWPCQTDDKEVYFYMDSSGTYELEATDREDVNNAIDGEYRPTDLAFHYDSSPVFEGNGETDIIYQEGSAGVPDGLAGLTWCNALGGDGKDCDQQYIRIRGNGYYNYARVCHETGHAVGLTHGREASPQLEQDDPKLGCMRTPSDGHSDLGDNNRENINATY
jgi:hypothetical protein